MHSQHLEFVRYKGGNRPSNEQFLDQNMTENMIYL